MFFESKLRTNSAVTEKGFPRVTAQTKIFSVFQILTGIDALKQATLMLYVTVMTDFFHQLTK